MSHVAVDGSRKHRAALGPGLSRGECAWYAKAMQRKRAGTMDLALIASLLAGIAALAAVATAGLVAWQIREQARAAHAAAGLESLWHVDEQWNAPAMLDVRSAAASALLARKPTVDVNTVLDFFDELVLLMDRGALDEELTALQFYWPLANYWAASAEYVRQVQRDEPDAWEKVAGLLKRLASVEAHRRERPLTEVLPSPDQVHQFLLDEQGSDECTDDDSENGKTPA